MTPELQEYPATSQGHARRRRHDRGATLVEYALLVSLVAVVAISSLTAITSSLPDMLAEVAVDDGVPHGFGADDETATTTSTTTTRPSTTITRPTTTTATTTTTTTTTRPATTTTYCSFRDRRFHRC